MIIPDWPAPSCVHAAVTLRRHAAGVSAAPFDTFNLGAQCGDDGAAVAANRSALVRALALPEAPRWLRQVHGRDVVEFDGTKACLDAPVADAAVTRSSDVVLAILTADCLPVLICAEDGSEIAAVHAGWRGLAAGVIEACVGRMISRRGQLMAWLGPAIGPASYEVGDDLHRAFIEQNAGAAAAFAPVRPGHWLCDLYTLAGQRLRALGIERIHGGGFDTFADKRFYSYRRDRATGRFASLIYRS